MKKLEKAVISAAVLAALPVFITAPGAASKKQKAPFMHRNFAHRGLHSADKVIPENSLPAFELAAAAGYGIELDVQLSKDGQVVVFHDDTLNRVCGVDARVDEKNYEELAALRLCDTEYSVPLFTDVLDVIAGRGPLIVELKTGKRNKELCRKTYEILKDYKGDVCIESFDPTIVAWFRFHGKELLRGQLAARPEDYEGETKKLTSIILGNTLLNFLARPQFIAHKTTPKMPLVRLACLLGAMKVVWTSHGPENESGNDAVIFEFYKPLTEYNA